MEPRQLQYLLAVVDAGSFTRAARSLGVRQPSISQAIKNLERELKRPLLDRLPGKVVPTAAGRELAEQARRILGELANLSRQTADADDRVTGTLTAAAIPTIAPFLFPRLRAAFATAYPEVHLKLVEETTPVLVSKVLTGEVDLAIASTVEETAHLHVDELATEPLVLMLPDAHRLATRKSISPDLLANEKLLSLGELNCLSTQAQRFCLKRGLKGETALTATNVFTLAAMTASGAGIALVPAMMAADKTIRIEGITYRPFAKPAPTRPLTALWSLLRYRPQSARRFAGMAREILAGAPHASPRVGAPPR